MPENNLTFKPYFVQQGVGPHIDEFVYASDEKGDVFRSDISLKKDGIIISDIQGRNKFSITVRWNVEGYGYLYISADNEGKFYGAKNYNSSSLNLNYELAKSRVKRNEKRLKKFTGEGYNPDKEISTLDDLSKEFLSDAKRSKNNEIKRAEFSQKSLKYSLWVSDLLELDKSRFDILKNGKRNDFLFGCDSRGYFQMKNKNNFLDIFSELFNYATITHYLKGDFINFEDIEGKKQFAERDALLKKLLKRNIIVEGRPLYWTHTWVTPDWLKNKSYANVLKYLEKHIREVVGHYGDDIKVWEVVNEIHDWAMEVELTNEQTIQLTKFACEIARDTNPNVRLLINNCCPFAEYVQKGKWHDRKAKYPQRTPYQFTNQLIEAGVDFDIVGVQVYFTQRSAADAILNIERYKKFGKKIHLAEVGAPSAGIAQEFLDKDNSSYSTKPYEWHRHWDEELQADWLEYIFSYAYSQDFIEAANWYDFVDPFGFLKNGGLLRSPGGEKKSSVHRLIKLKEKWNNL
jgi:endo-1,4-beta-xylanase